MITNYNTTLSPAAQAYERNLAENVCKAIVAAQKAGSKYGVPFDACVTHTHTHETNQPPIANCPPPTPTDYSHILTPSSMKSKNVLPRVAALLDVQPVTDVVKVLDAATFVRPMYAGNALATVTTAEPVKVLSVRATAFDKAPATGGQGASVEPAPAVDGAADAGVSAFVSESVSKSTRPELSAARVVVSGGRGLKTKENFQMLETLADKLKGAGA